MSQRRRRQQRRQRQQRPRRRQSCCRRSQGHSQFNHSTVASKALNRLSLGAKIHFQWKKECLETGFSNFLSKADFWPSWCCGVESELTVSAGQWQSRFRKVRSPSRTRNAVTCHRFLLGTRKPGPTLRLFFGPVSERTLAVVVKVLELRCAAIISCVRLSFLVAASPDPIAKKLGHLKLNFCGETRHSCPKSFSSVSWNTCCSNVWYR